MGVAVFEPPGHTRVFGKLSATPDGLPRVYLRIQERVVMELVNATRTQKGGIRAILKLSDSQFEDAKNGLVKDGEDSNQKLIKSSK